MRAEAKTAQAARDFLHAAAEIAATLPGHEGVTVYPPVPTSVARVANVERMQMLVESTSRLALQRFMALWLPTLHELRRERGGSDERILRWAMDVDPLMI
jgi:primosomal protein N' (replication factor Y)